ncbi:FaeA/PapI family transcriptional regulator [Escherichia coli]|uniref:FaeA/PapI family transcriptional regulator n=1 Tax=Escherichia coli TaxID=562 RepID=UPI003CCBF490
MRLHCYQTGNQSQDATDGALTKQHRCLLQRLTMEGKIKRSHLHQDAKTLWEMLPLSDTSTERESERQ